MPIKVSKSSEGVVTIAIQGRFNFDLHKAFRSAYTDPENATQHYVLDLRDTEYMDSSALGMMLLLREHVGGSQADIRVVGCRPEIRHIFTISNFDRLFRIDC